MLPFFDGSATQSWGGFLVEGQMRLFLLTSVLSLFASGHQAVGAEVITGIQWLGREKK
jgi:hypothetical protein